MIDDLDTTILMLYLFFVMLPVCYYKVANASKYKDALLRILVDHKMSRYSR